MVRRIKNARPVMPNLLKERLNAQWFREMVQQ